MSDVEIGLCHFSRQQKAVMLPPHGGDTLFADQVKAYEEMPDEPVSYTHLTLPTSAIV